MPRVALTRAERFEAKVRNDPDGHRTWTGGTDSMGYGRFAWDATRGGRKVISAARAALLLAGVDMPDDLEPDHTCKRRLCVNTECLEAVTHQVNVRRSGSLGGLRSRQTHCKHGHEFTPENTRINRNGTRQCRACARREVYEHMARRNGTAPPSWQGWLGGC